LDDETIEWLLNTCPRSSAAKQWIETTGSNDDDVCLTRIEPAYVIFVL